MVDGIQSSGTVRLTKPKKVKGGKADEPAALSGSGRTAMSSCSVEGLRGHILKASNKQGKKKKGKKKKRVSHHRTGARPCCLQRPEGTAV